MASVGGNILPADISPNHVLAGIAGVALFALGVSQLYTQSDQESDEGPGLITSLFLFCYSCFIKPYGGDSNGSQQGQLESFYATQSGIYDKTRKPLLKGREDMLALVAAQLQFKAKRDGESRDGKKRVWVDVLLPSLPSSMAASGTNQRTRLEEGPAGTSRPCRNTSTFRASSPGSTSSTSPRLCARWRASASSDLVGPT